MRAVRKTTFVLCTAAALGAAAACSSSSSKSSGSGEDASTDGGAGIDAVIDVINNPNNCVKPGTANNTEGVGGYCNPGGGQCDKAGPGGAPTLCTGDTGGVTNGWFCTIPCPATCGAGAMCVSTTMGAICAPAACLGVLGDASLLESEGGADAMTPADGSSGDGPTTDSSPSDAPTGDAPVSDGASAG
jgi:hypothetical protein